jgi:acyl-CoA synthetase (AMP-forming)/AMP-acid ligase II
MIRTMDRLLDEWADHQANLVAHIVAGGETMTYGDWRRRSHAVAATLSRCGVGRGHTVALAFPRERITDLAVCLTAVSRLGAIAMLLPVDERPTELLRLTSVCRPDRFIAAEPVVSDLRAAGLTAVTVAELADTEHAAPDPVADPADVATVVFTSGTTGVPKAVAITHHDVVSNLGERRHGGTLLHSFPLSVPVGQWAALAPLRALRCVTLAEFQPRAFLELIDAHQVTETAVVPALAVAMGAVVRNSAGAQPKAAFLERVTIGSARCPASTLHILRNLFPRARIIVDYASTESGSAGTSIDFAPNVEPGTVGRPHAGSAVRIVAENGQEARRGEEGVVELRLPPGTPPRHYVGDPDATADTFRGRWVRMADVGYLDDRGLLHLTGRTVEFANLSGRKVSCTEVEQTFESHPAVSEAAVFPVADAILGEELAAAVVAEPSTPVDELRRHVGARLAAHKVPSRIHVLDALPRTRGGKIRRNELAQLLQSAPVASRSEVEAVLRAAAGEVTGEPVPAGPVLLSDLGASSVQLIRIYHKVAEALAADFDLDLLLRPEPLPALAQYIAHSVGQNGRAA